MSDSMMPRSALAGTVSLREVGHALALQEHPGSTLLYLEGSCPGSALSTVLAALGLAELPDIGRSGGRNGARLLGLGPDIWLLVCDASVSVPDALTLGGPIGHAFEVTLDKTHAYTRIEIRGIHAIEFIAKACALDLHPRNFALGACAAAGFAGMRVIMWREADQFDLLVGRSYAVSLWEWMVDAAAEYGVVPAGAPAHR
jgi:sarcosine oxidase subunit gamma